jgi:hypothetical protein
MNYGALVTESVGIQAIAKEIEGRSAFATQSPYVPAQTSVKARTLCDIALDKGRIIKYG